MSLVNITNIKVLNNPAKFLDSFKFDVTFECISHLKEDLEWKVVYVGSAEDEFYDQTLDCIMVGPVPVGINKFVFEAEHPNPSLIPKSDLIGCTVILILCLYKGQEFVRVGYYVNNTIGLPNLTEPILSPNELLEEEENSQLINNDKIIEEQEIIIEEVWRNILADKPRVTRFPIKWDDLLDEMAMPSVPAELDEEEILQDTQAINNPAATNMECIYNE